MTRTLSIAMLILLIAGMASASWFETCWLSDHNKFLANFVNQELLAVLGVIVTITLASAASLHLELNRLEDDHGEGFEEARTATKAYAYLLIWLFLGAIALVIIKPIAAQTPLIEAGFNSAAIFIIVLNVMALMDLTGAVFQIPAKRRIKP